MLKKAAVFLALFTLLVGLTPALAQDGSTLGLSEADFALYTQGSSYAFDSLALDYTFTLSVNQETLTITGSGIGGTDASGSPVAQLTLTGGGLLDVEGTGTPQQVNVDAELRLVNNILYLIDNTGDQGWQGFALEELLSDITGDALAVDPDELAAGDMSSLGDLGGVFEGMSSLMDAGFVHVARLADASVNGVNTAHFQTTFDFNLLLSSDFLKNIMVESGQITGTAEEIDQQFQFFQSFLGMFFQGLSLSLDQYIAVDTPRIEQTTVNFGMTIPAMTEDTEPMALSLTLDITMAEYNPAVSVEAPANATMVDPNALMEEAGVGGF